MTTASPSPFRIGLIGFGNIGTGLVRHLRDYMGLIADRLEAGVELAGIADVDFERARDVEPPASARLTGRWQDLVEDSTIDLIVELVGVGRDGKPTLAREIAVASLNAGKHVVTANKGLIAACGGELHELAASKGKLLLYEASVGAGIPVITAMQTSLAANRLTGIQGIVNGTSNYILMRMEEDEALTMEAAIQEAQEKGYAEPDPTFDVEGHDAAYKLVILASLAFGQEFRFENVRMEGIRKLTKSEFDYARREELTVKLLASGRQHPDGTVELEVGPTFLPSRHVLAGVRGVFNAILLEGVPIGDTLYYGRGAGQESTASGLLGDVLLAARTQRTGAPDPYPLRIPRGGATLRPEDQILAQHYLRVEPRSPKALDKIEALAIEGQRVERGATRLEVVTPYISRRELDNLLGKFRNQGVSEDEICHVRFAGV